MQNFSDSFGAFWYQHRSQIMALLGLLTLLVFILSIGGVVIAEPGTGGGTCSGC